MSEFIDDAMVKATAEACGSEKCARNALEAALPMIGQKLAKEIRHGNTAPRLYELPSEHFAARIRELTAAYRASTPAAPRDDGWQTDLENVPRSQIVWIGHSLLGTCALAYKRPVGNEWYLAWRNSMLAWLPNYWMPCITPSLPPSPSPGSETAPDDLPLSEAGR